jgi:hypothetical protein
MKMVFYLGLFLTATLFSFGQTTEKKAPAPKGEQKKEQHVKVMVSQNGKVVKIDTTFNFADEKVVKFKVDSMLEKLGVNESGAGDKSVIVIHKGKEMHMGHAGGNMPGEKQINVFYEISDSAARKGGKKMVWHTDEGNVVMISDEGNMMPPPPPPPPMPGMHVRSFKMHGDPFAMDPNDKDIVTYDKKDIGKGLEKITIVRKKRPEPEQSKEVEVQVEVNEEKNK